MPDKNPDLPQAEGPLLVEELFYPSKSQEREALYSTWSRDFKKAEESCCFILPHGDWSRCGALLYQAFKSLENNHYRRVILLSSRHGYFDSDLLVPDFDHYTLDSDTVEIDTNLVTLLTIPGSGIRKDSLAFKEETATETVLPFLGRFLPENKILPLICGNNTLKTAENLIRLLENIWDPAKDLLLVLSNLSSAEQEELADKQADEILRLLTEKKDSDLYEIFSQKKISPCGLAPLIAIQKMSFPGGKSFHTITRQKAVHKYENRLNCVHYGVLILSGG